MFLAINDRKLSGAIWVLPDLKTLVSQLYTGPLWARHTFFGKVGGTGFGLLGTTTEPSK